MFQSIKRAKFLGQNNFSHWDTGDLVKMHLWLQKNGWPANEFVDLFMRAYPDFDRVMDSIAFEHFMCNQYEWVRNDDVKALREFFDKVNNDRFKREDRAGLIQWLEPMVSGAKER
jgi:hypothetical protein